MLCICQPLSVVIHHEGVSSGAKEDGGAKRFQSHNLAKLRERWQTELALHPAPGVDPDSLLDRSLCARVLFLDTTTPTPDRDAGSVAAFNLMLMLRQAGMQVTFVPVDDLRFLEIYTPQLQRVGVEVLYEPFVTSLRVHLKAEGARYDLVFVVRPDVAERHCNDLRKLCPRAQLLYLSPDLHFLRLAREVELHASSSATEAAARMRARELALMAGVNAVIVHSDVEQAILEPLLPDIPVNVLPWVIGVSSLRPALAGRRDIVFVGGYRHAPNVDAVLHFVHDIFPRVLAELPNVRFIVVGGDAPDELRALASQSVEIIGHVADLAAVLVHARVSVAPLRFGAGIKGKIVTALGAGVPVVASPLAVEGMGLQPGEQILVEADPELFARAVVRVCRDDDFWTEVSDAGLEAVRTGYSEAAGEKALRGLLASVGRELPPGRFVQGLLSPLDNRRGQPAVTEESIRAMAPIAAVRDAKEYSKALGLESVRLAAGDARSLCERAGSPSFTMEGICAPCGRRVPFAVDAGAGGLFVGDALRPNWRERLECPRCRMNNRQRLMATLLRRAVEELPADGMVYLMEQVTPIYQWAVASFGSHRIIGSEYLGAGCESGAEQNGLRHEDALALSFPDASICLIVSNDVFEHVRDPQAAFRESARVLCAGGTLLFSVPFNPSTDRSIIRAVGNIDGTVRQLLPAVYHGNPLSPHGSLVFTDFGWDMLEMVRESGFASARAELWLDPEMGHVGPPQIVFSAFKP
jgi:glycosyltransferase involved in cell wall biosynthesis